MDTGLINKINLHSRQKKQGSKGQSSESSPLQRAPWWRNCVEKQDVSGEEFGGGTYLDIPTYMRRGIKLSVMAVD